MARKITISVGDVPQYAALYLAVHQVLLERLLGGVSINAWNDLLEAHDAIAQGIAQGFVEEDH